MLMDSGLGDIWIASLDPTGMPRWAGEYGGRSNDRGESIAVGGGMVCMTGMFGATVSFGAGSETSSGTFLDVFVACYASADGAARWSAAFGGSRDGITSVEGIAIDGTSRVHAVGS